MNTLVHEGTDREQGPHNRRSCLDADHQLAVEKRPVFRVDLELAATADDEDGKMNGRSMVDG